MPDLDTSEQEEIAQDECLGNKAEKGIVKVILFRRAHRSWKRVSLVPKGTSNS